MPQSNRCAGQWTRCARTCLHPDRGRAFARRRTVARSVITPGATDGWVPYPFLNPDTGYARVFFSVGMIVVAFLAFGSLIFAISRVPAALRVLRE